MKKLFTYFILMLAIGYNAQPPGRFYTSFGGGGVDIGYSVKQTLDKSYIIVGSTTSYGAGNSDVYLVKMDTMGWTTWQKTFGGFGNDIGRSVIQLNDSGYVIAGFTNSYGAGGYDAYVIRTDKAGTLMWQTTIGGTDWDFGYDIVESSDGNLVMCGSTTSFGQGNTDGLVAKLNTNGGIIWQKYYGGVEEDEFRAVIKTNDNKLALAGMTKSKGDLNGDCYFNKLDLNGDTVFTRTFGSAGKDYLTDLVQKPSNEYIVAGAKTYSANPYTNSAYFNFDLNGNFNWEGNYNNSNGNENIVAATNSQLGDKTAYIRNIPVQSYMMQGSIGVAKNTGIYPYLANEFGGTEDETILGIDRTRDGGYICVGTTNSFNSFNGDVFIIKQDSTIITTASIVNVKEIAVKQQQFVFTYDEDNLLISSAIQNAGLLEMYEMNGNIILKRKITENKTEINLSAYKSGIYLIRIFGQDGTIFTRKIVFYKTN